MKTNSLDFDAQALREKILDLAMRGKLVKQDPNDEPASVLLEKIKAEKEELVKEGKIKKSKPLPKITDEEKPFDIPDSWEWVRLGEYAEKVTDQVASGSFAAIKENVRKYKHEEFALMIKTADFANNFSKNLTYTDEHGYKFLSNSNLFGGELILSNIGSIGKCFIVPNLKKPMTLAPNSIMVKVPEETLKKFLYYFIQSPVGNSELWKITSGTTMKKFNKTGLKTILVPVPPLEEQSRIAAKIAQLFALLRKFESLLK
ncbi:restriction endonuclease subunit S [Lactobacillus johnsonii]|uniref:restriction endonuclease subunit S n=1 Tax=Lactobacillus johnsonii TaxID=33959 RepID=UPI00398B9FB4